MVKLSNKQVGSVLILAAIIFAVVSIPSFGDRIGNIVGGIVEENGKELSCQVSFDKDSIHSASCVKVDTCRTSLGSTFSLFTVDRILRFQDSGVTIYKKDFDLGKLGGNDQAGWTSCVPEFSTSGRLDLINENGGYEATTEVFYS